MTFPLPDRPSEHTPSPSSIDYEELGYRLRAYRIGASLPAEEVAERLGISRAALYRMEQGKIVKIETLERLAQLLGTSMASLLGVEVEYYSTAQGFLERMRQIEQSADRIVAHFEPISLLLASEEYLGHLQTMLLESIPAPRSNATHATQRAIGYHEEVAGILDILHERKAAFADRHPNIVSLVGLRKLELFLQTGLIGTLDLDETTRQKRIQAARREVERIADLMENAPMSIQIALVEDAMPAASFQLFYGAQKTTLAVSPFRLGEMPSIRNGIATITAAPEPVRLYEKMIDQLWKDALKEKTGASQLRKLLRRT
jgi:transcriptional regulator with XRE-family HTH domain